MSLNRLPPIPTTTYRSEDFVGAARKLDVDLVNPSDRPLDAVVAVDDFTTRTLGQPRGGLLTRPERARRRYRRDPGGRPHE